MSETPILSLTPTNGLLGKGLKWFEVMIIDENCQLLE